MKTNQNALAGLILGLFLSLASDARAFYNPQTGRWLSRDPIGEAGGANLTVFTHNDLVNLIDPLGLWKRDGWSGGWAEYSGTATAECGDTLSILAELITGNAFDWAVLGIPPTIEPGQIVNIAPLLVVLENRMRANVVAATGPFRATFGSAMPPIDASGSDDVSRFFGSGEGVQASCGAAADIVMAKGLLDTIGATDFNDLGYNSVNYPPAKKSPAEISQLKVGDGTRFKNYDDYMELTRSRGNWSGENVIKVGEDRYWGFGDEQLKGEQRSQAGWYGTLRRHYFDETGRNRSDPIPGFEGYARFVDVAKVGMQVFDLRKSRE